VPPLLHTAAVAQLLQRFPQWLPVLLAVAVPTAVAPLLVAVAAHIDVVVGTVVAAAVHIVADVHTAAAGMTVADVAAHHHCAIDYIHYIHHYYLLHPLNDHTVGIVVVAAVQTVVAVHTAVAVGMAVAVEHCIVTVVVFCTHYHCDRLLYERCTIA
jgi:hypothetical protein